MTTARAGLGRGIKAVNEMHEFTLTFGDVLQNIAELRKGDVSDLAPPKSVHGFDIERFQNDDVKARPRGTRQVMRQLEEPVPALVCDPFMHSYKVVVGFTPVMATFDFAGKVAVRVTDVIQTSLKELRRSNHFAGRQGEEGFQTKVCANDGVTQSVDFFLFRLYGKANEQFPKQVALDRDRFDRAENFPAFAELVDFTLNANLIGTDQLPTGLLERKRRVLFDLAEPRPCKALRNLPGFVLKKQLITPIDTLANVLNGLTSNQIPKRVLGQLFQLGNVLLHIVHADILSGQLEVPPLKSNAVIPDDPADVNLVVQMLILFASVQLELERFHGLISGTLHQQDGLQWRSYLHRFPHKSAEASLRFLPRCGIGHIVLSYLYCMLMHAVCM